MDALAKLTYVNLRPVAKQLERIADCLEVIIRFQYGYSMRKPVLDESGEEPSVEFQDQDAMAEDEVLDALAAAGRIERREP